MKKFNLVKSTDLDLPKLCKGSALTWEGMSDSQKNLEAIMNALEDCGSKPKDGLTFYSTSGLLMNEVYGLTGDNRYRDDLTILSIMLDDFDNWEALVMWRFNCGGRWFDDIVWNNRYREDRM